MINEFQFALNTKVIFKPNALKDLGTALADAQISKVLLVTDPGVAGAGFVEPTTQVLDDSGIAYRVFKDIEPNPSVETVDKGAALNDEIEFQAIIALGGGSPMDAAKAIAVKLTNGGNIPDYEGPDNFTHDPLPIYAIPTTAGTGSEVTPFAVITDKARKYKLTIISQRILPKVAILDPTLIANLPPSVAASTGLDSLTHAVEAYTSLFSSPYSDAFAEKAISLIGKNIRLFVANRKNERAAGKMLVASLFAGLAFSHARLGNAHAMAHPLGGFFNIPHGIANAVLLPHIMEYNRMACPEKFQKIADLLEEDASAACAVEAVKKLNRDLGIPENLSVLGVNKDTIPEMAADAMKSGNILANPRQTDINEIEFLYKQAM